MSHRPCVAIVALICGLPTGAWAWTQYGPPVDGLGLPYDPAYGYRPGYPPGASPGSIQADPIQAWPYAPMTEGSAPPPPPKSAQPDAYGAPLHPYQGFRYGPPVTSPPMSAWGYDTVPRGPTVPTGRLGVSVQTTDDAYLVSIETGGTDPEEIEISAKGRGLTISRDTVTTTEQKDTSADGQGYRRSFSFSRGSSTRRIPMPPDADLSQMSRENTAVSIQLLIPRNLPSPR